MSPTCEDEMTQPTTTELGELLIRLTTIADNCIPSDDCSPLALAGAESVIAESWEMIERIKESEKKRITVQFETGQEDRQSDVFGPFEFVQLTYGSIRVGENGDEFLAEHNDGWWVTQDGQKWSDVIIG